MCYSRDSGGPLSGGNRSEPPEGARCLLTVGSGVPAENFLPGP